MSYNATLLPCLIASGGSLSAPCSPGGEYSLVGIAFPASWTAADITFQVSFNGVVWHELRDDAGTPIQKTVTAGQYREYDSSEFKSAIYLKIRSGTVDSPVNQTADRTLTVACRRYMPR